MYLEQGYEVIGVNICPVLGRCAERVARHAVVKATWQPIREPAQNVPREVMEDCEAKKAGLKPLALGTIVPDQTMIKQTWSTRAIRRLYKTRTGAFLYKQA